MLDKIKFLIFFLIIIGIPANINAQDISVKGGVGFYSFYENTFYTGKVKMNATPNLAVSLSWQVGDLFSLSWENSFRFKLIRADYIGIDTVSLKEGINFYHDFNFFNIDSKVLGIFSLMNYEEGKFFAVVGTGISVPLNYESKFHRVNPNVVLNPAYYRMMPDANPTFFRNTGILTEIGIGINHKKISLTANFLTELFKADLSDVGKIQTSLIQINFGYNF